MTLDRASLRRAISTRRLADWVLTERHRDSLSLSSSGIAWRSERSAHLRVLVRRDLPSGRGTGVVEVEEQQGDAPTVVGRAVALAEAAIEPSWITPPPSAPARVSLLDEAAAGALEPAAEGVRAALADAAHSAGLALPSWSAKVAREELALGSAQGFEVSWRQSEYQVSAVVSRDGRQAALRRTARRVADLDLAASMRALAEELARPAPALARALPARPVVLELSIDAMLGDDELGVWRAITELADARAQRRGLVRAAIERRAAPSSSALTVWSDGALPYGARSAPVGDEAEAVRRFRLFSDGAPGEPGLGPREAARAGRAPNGGVRNLVIEPGGAGVVDGAEATLDGAPILDVRRLRWLTIDPSSGRAEAELALALDRQRPEQSLGVGTFSVDLVGALAHAERATKTVRRGSYLGPAWIRIGPLVLR